MNNKILIAASVCLSVFAAAQSQTDQPKPSTAQGSANLEQKNVVHRDLAARDMATGHASGKKSASDDWTQQNAVSTTHAPTVKPVSSNSGTKAQTRVATGDVNGDGVADKAAKNSAHATESITVATPSKTQSPRDVATGQMSGKRQHQPVVVTKESDKSSNK
jgi:hypothetical protein